MLHSLTADIVIARSSHAIGTEIGQETVLLHSQRWTYLELNLAGQAIWKLLETPQKLSSLIAALIADFCGNEPTCCRDVLRFIDGMHAEDFVSVTRSP